MNAICWKFGKRIQRMNESSGCDFLLHTIIFRIHYRAFRTCWNDILRISLDPWIDETILLRFATVSRSKNVHPFDMTAQAEGKTIKWEGKEERVNRTRLLMLRAKKKIQNCADQTESLLKTIELKTGLYNIRLHNSTGSTCFIWKYIVHLKILL